MDNESILDIAKKYAELVKKSLSVEQILLYGSYAKETAGTHSDIDIAIIVDDIKGDYLEEQVKLYKLRRTVDLRIEPVLLLSDQDNSGFLAEVMATGQIIYNSSSLQ